MKENFVERLRNQIHRVLGKREEKERIQLFPWGFRLLSGSRSKGEVRWDGVSTITAFKEDLLTTDLICMEFLLETDGIIFEVNEEVDGFWDLADKVLTIFPSADHEWRPKVMQPPFARNPTVIYQRR